MSDLQIESLLACLSIQTCFDLSIWVDVGFNLYNLHVGGDTGLSLWRRFTEAKCPGKLKHCDQIYPHFLPGKSDLSGLARLARRDDPEKYQRWHTEWVTQSSFDDNLGEMIYRIFWLELEYIEPFWFTHKNDKLERIGLTNLDVYVYFETPKIIKKCHNMNLWRAYEIIQQWRDPIFRQETMENLKIRFTK